MRLRVLCASLTCAVALGLAPHGAAPVRGRGLTRMGVGQAAEEAAEETAAEETPGYQLFVRNVPWKASVSDLREAMGQYGVVTNAWLKPRPEAPSKHMGFGFVTFHSASSADAAPWRRRRMRLGGYVRD